MLRGLAVEQGGLLPETIRDSQQVFPSHSPTPVFRTCYPFCLLPWGESENGGFHCCAVPLQLSWLGDPCRELGRWRSFLRGCFCLVVVSPVPCSRSTGVWLIRSSRCALGLSCGTSLCLTGFGSVISLALISRSTLLTPGWCVVSLHPLQGRALLPVAVFLLA